MSEYCHFSMINGFFKSWWCINERSSWKNVTLVFLSVAVWNFACKSFHTVSKWSKKSSNSMRASDAYCSKITKNVSLAFYNYGIFDLLKSTCLATLFDSKLHIFKNSPNWSSMAFLMNFWQVFMLLASLEILNETFLWFSNTVLSIWKEVEKKTRNSVTPYRRPVDHQTVDFKNLLLLVNHFYLPSCGLSKQQ